MMSSTTKVSNLLRVVSCRWCVDPCPLFSYFDRLILIARAKREFMQCDKIRAAPATPFLLFFSKPLYGMPADKSRKGRFEAFFLFRNRMIQITLFFPVPIPFNIDTDVSVTRFHISQLTIVPYWYQPISAEGSLKRMDRHLVNWSNACERTRLTYSWEGCKRVCGLIPPPYR